MNSNQGNNGQGNSWRRPQRPHEQDTATRAVLANQQLLQFQQQQLVQMQAQLAQQQQLLMQMGREILLRMEFQALKERMPAGLTSSPSASGTPGMPDTPNTLAHMTFGTHHALDMSDYTNL
ncbi:hypothetical protein NW762_013549 [Fusarium torreyae]|uniref:Uncharacterized protein n=1 Tax=Fusarium torreyae TaxID=1237075 RepID=A0A9W8RKK0_9HYPO|nr:hypothetical protein NW762_013549 [Fusarium torreyae]